MEFKSINAEQGIDRVGNRINRIIMEFKFGNLNLFEQKLFWN